MKNDNPALACKVRASEDALQVFETCDFNSKVTFKDWGNMTSARAGHTATLLNTGKVLIAGGFDSPPGGCCSFASAELYDPSTGTFSPTGRMNFGTDGQIATLLANGRVLTENGFGGDGAIELYDPGTSTFSLTGASGFRDLYAASATLLANPKGPSHLGILARPFGPGRSVRPFDRNVYGY